MAGIDDLSSLSLSRPQRNEKHRIVLWKFNGRRLVGNGLSMKFSGLFSGLGEEVSLLSLHASVACSVALIAVVQLYFTTEIPSSSFSPFRS